MNKNSFPDYFLKIKFSFKSKENKTGFPYPVKDFEQQSSLRSCSLLLILGFFLLSHFTMPNDASKFNMGLLTNSLCSSGH